MLENEKKFVQHKFGKDRVDAKSTTRFFPMNYNSRLDYVKMIYRSDVQLSDSIKDFGGLMTEYDTAYFLEEKFNRLLPYKNKFQNSITFEMSLNKRVFIRHVYTFLDMIGDLGGLFGALTPLCVIIVSIFQYQSSYQFVMADMFVDRKDSNPDADPAKTGKNKVIDESQVSQMNLSTSGKLKSQKSKSVTKRKNDIQWNSIKSFMINVQTLIP